MNRKFFALVVGVVLAGLWAGAAFGAAYYEEGRTGDSWEDAYIIDSAEDLRLMRDRLNDRTDPANKYYRLGADIDLTRETGWNGIDNFTGAFDGDGYTVRVNFDNRALFYRVMGRVENLHVEGASTIAGIIEILGVSTNNDNPVIENCSFTGTVKSGNSIALDENVGGIVCNLQSGTIRDCTFSGDVNSSGTVAGGILGSAISSIGTTNTIENCRVNSGSTISITHRDDYSYAGGIVGYIYQGNVNNCSSEATVTGATYRGGIAGNAAANTTFSQNTWPSELYPEIGTQSTPNPQVNEKWNTNFMLNTALLNSIASAFGVDPSEIHTFASDEISSESWGLDESDIQSLSNMGEQNAMTLPIVNVKADGVYVMQCRLDELNAGDRLNAHSIVSGYPGDIGGIDAAAIGNDVEYIFLDQNYNVVNTVPSNKTVYLAMRLKANTPTRSVITRGGGSPVRDDDRLPTREIGIIEELDEDIIRNIAATLTEQTSFDVEVDQIRLLRSVDLQAPEEPTEAMKQEAKDDGYEFAYKLNTIYISSDVELNDDIYYVFSLDVPPELVGKSVNDLRLYILPFSDVDTSSVNASLFSFGGILGTLLDEQGFGLDIPLPAQILIAVMLPIKTSFFVGLAKILLALALGGCNAVLMPVGGTVILVGGIVIFAFFRKR